MTTAGGLLIADAEARLRRESERLRSGPPLDRLLATWLLPDPLSTEARSAAQAALIQWREAQRGVRLRSYQGVTALALAWRMDRADEDRRSAFFDGLDWVLGTAADDAGTPVGLAADPPAILAVASTLAGSDGDRRRIALGEWVAAVHARFAARQGMWERAQLQVAADLLGQRLALPPELADACRVTRIAVAAPGDVVAGDDAQTVIAAILEHHADVDAVGATFLLAALSRAKATVIRSVRSEAMTVDDVLALLRNVTSSLRDWTWEERPRTKTAAARQWHVDHEYHVQNLLWVVLAPLFPDLESESYSSKVGSTQPRADLVIPSLRLIIEAKFARATDSLKDIQRQLAQDAALYFPQGGAYERMIAFVWDDGARSEEHPTLVQGLEKLERIAGVVVVARPAKMRPARVGACERPEGEGS